MWRQDPKPRLESWLQPHAPHPVPLSCACVQPPRGKEEAAGLPHVAPFTFSGFLLDWVCSLDSFHFRRGGKSFSVSCCTSQIEGIFETVPALYLHFLNPLPTSCFLIEAPGNVVYSWKRKPRMMRVGAETSRRVLI